MLNFGVFLPLVMNVLMLPLIIGCNQKEQIHKDEDNIPVVTVTVDLSSPDIISNFSIGITHTNYMWENGKTSAVALVKKLLEEGGIHYQNEHIMGWGADNPEPTPGNFSWTSLDKRMNLIRSISGTIPIITFCSAPGWMKVKGTDWNMEDRVADEHVADFALLCQKVALRYPDVKYFQVWNEFKGYRSWVGSVETKDYLSFLKMYNAVYDSVKAVRPDAKIGGPYMPMGGNAISESDKMVVDYWLKNCAGADFFTYDGWLEGWPPGGKTEEWMMGRTSYFGDLTKQFSAMTNLPVWISEYYAGSNSSPEFTAINHASTYYHSLISGSHMALLWDPFSYGKLFSKTDVETGGQPTPNYFVVKIFNTYFGPGTQLYMVSSSSADIEVLASREKILLINKRPAAVSVMLNGKPVSLAKYEVKLVDASTKK